MRVPERRLDLLRRRRRERREVKHRPGDDAGRRRRTRPSATSSLRGSLRRSRRSWVVTAVSGVFDRAALAGRHRLDVSRSIRDRRFDVALAIVVRGADSSPRSVVSSTIVASRDARGSARAEGVPSSSYAEARASSVALGAAAAAIIGRPSFGAGSGDRKATSRTTASSSDAPSRVLVARASRRRARGSRRATRVVAHASLSQRRRARSRVGVRPGCVGANEARVSVCCDEARDLGREEVLALIVLDAGRRCPRAARSQTMSSTSDASHAPSSTSARGGVPSAMRMRDACAPARASRAGSRRAPLRRAITLADPSPCRSR